MKEESIKIEVVGINLEELKGGTILMIFNAYEVTRETAGRIHKELESRGIDVVGFFSKHPDTAVKFYSIPHAEDVRGSNEVRPNDQPKGELGQGGQS